MQTKTSIRKHFLERRLNLPEEEAAARNEALLYKIRELDFSKVQWVHVFLPITEKKEVNTWPIIEWLRSTHPAVQLVLAKAFLATGEMEHYLWEPHTILVKSKYGIPEPAGGSLIAPEMLDLVFVPLLAFDHSGQRVGYGKGMYDRFLKQCRPGVRTIGLSLFEPVDRITDTDPRDVPLHTVITPEKIYHFSNIP
ncbi:5-formyltetrahydrofolate cyclo-ligase [uncultured Chitinophaga sp.]|uniref:5-formyltetrahydrofolate cyclo-ligase n=1 Tax=uncultured Chitinophaga sp. TaxID=339340 RepID=UPI00262E1C6B|nr:5-formyltetrahydrofolate cyclo-ligase [uncultured Chitinophaga sp.]